MGQKTLRPPALSRRAFIISKVSIRDHSKPNGRRTIPDNKNNTEKRGKERNRLCHCVPCPQLSRMQPPQATFSMNSLSREIFSSQPQHAILFMHAYDALATKTTERLK